MIFKKNLKNHTFAVIFNKTHEILLFFLTKGIIVMGQQLNKIIKRRRRKAYLERIRERVKAQIAAK
jgi:hypothetical protein